MGNRHPFNTTGEIEGAISVFRWKLISVGAIGYKELGSWTSSAKRVSMIIQVKFN